MTPHELGQRRHICSEEDAKAHEAIAKMRQRDKEWGERPWYRRLSFEDWIAWAVIAVVVLWIVAHHIWKVGP